MWGSCELLLVACGARDAGDQGSKHAAALPSLASLPATVEGFLEWDASVGEDAENNEGRGLGETSLGTLTVGDQEIWIEAETRLLEAARVPYEGAKVRATLGSREGDDDPTYLITSVTLL